MIYAVAVVIIYLIVYRLSNVLTWLSQSPTKATTSQMASPKAKLSKVKCEVCRRKYNLKKCDIVDIKNKCPAENCELRGERFASMFKSLEKKELAVIERQILSLPAPKDDKREFEVHEVDDLIIMRIDAKGKTRTLPKV